MDDNWAIKRGEQWISAGWKSPEAAKQAARRYTNPHHPTEFEIVNTTGIGVFKGSFDGNRMKWEKMR